MVVALQALVLCLRRDVAPTRADETLIAVRTSSRVVMVVAMGGGKYRAYLFLFLGNNGGSDRRGKDRGEGN